MRIFKKKFKFYTDEQLVEYIKRGNTHAFEELYSRYNHRLLHYFFRMLGGDENKAQDFLQETFLKIIEKPDLFHKGNKFSSWLFTIANNLCKNEYRWLEIRKNVGNREDLDSIPIEENGSLSRTENSIDRKLFERALLIELTKIDIPHRSTFLLRFQENYSIKEISIILNCSEGTVKSRLYYTSQKLAAKLKDFNPIHAEVT